MMGHMPSRVSWTRDQLLLVFRLYCGTPFGRLHARNPEIAQLAKVIGRTPGAVAMKACNFASLDPAQTARGIKALGNLSAADRQVWREFAEDSEALAAEAEAAFDRLVGGTTEATDDQVEQPAGPSEVVRAVRTRRVQAFFRIAVLSSYNFRCALTGLAIPALLNASHIIPWSVDPKRRADPRNGLCLNALHDRAFDRGLITFDEQWRLVLSPSLRQGAPAGLHRTALIAMEGCPLMLPERFMPDPEAMGWHRSAVFTSN